MSEGVIKTNPRPQEFYRAGTAPSGFEIPGSATAIRLTKFLCRRFLIPTYTIINYLGSAKRKETNLNATKPNEMKPNQHSKLSKPNQSTEVLKAGFND